MAPPMGVTIARATRAVRAPAATALECEGERISYADLDQRANRLANLLLSRDIRAGSRVGILLNRSVDTYVALLGVTKTEPTFVPIDPDLDLSAAVLAAAEH